MVNHRVPQCIAGVKYSIFHELYVGPKTHFHTHVNSFPLDVWSRPVRCFERCTLVLSMESRAAARSENCTPLFGLERAVPKLRTSKKLNMQPGDATTYEAEARAYFESLRQPFEQTLKATEKNRSALLIGIGPMILLIMVVVVLPFVSPRLVTLVFRQDKYTFLGKSYPITDTAALVFLSCLIALGALSMIALAIKIVEFRSAARPLSQRAMVFALSFAILRELQNSERSHQAYHRQSVIQLFAKLLTYLRWTLQGMNPDSTSFHHLPSKAYPVASYAQQFAEALNWSETRKNEYDVVIALNNLHPKISPRLQNHQDIPLVKAIFQGIGNFFYTTVVQPREGQASWGYSELLRSADIINRMSVIAEPQGSQGVRFLSLEVFTHPNIAVALCAWWLVLQALIVVLLATAFHFFPTMTMNSQAMVGLIAAPIAAAISIVGISRKSS